MFRVRMTSVKQCVKLIRQVNSSITRIPSVLVPIANGTEEIEAVTIVDVLVRAGANVTTACVGTTPLELTVKCSRGVTITADLTIEQCSTTDWDMVVLPGGLKGAQIMRDNDHIQAILTHHDMVHKRPLGAICAAPAVILAQSDQLRERAVTCYPGFDKLIAHNYKPNETVVIDGNLITSQGPGTAMQFALTLVKVLFGRDKAESVAKELLYDCGW